MQQNTKPWFNNATETMSGEVAAVMAERGGQNGDSWKDNQQLAMKAVKREIDIHGSKITDNQNYRLLALAALVDIKYQRLMGGYKEDTPIDMVNYLYGLAYAVREMKTVKPEQSK